MDTTTEALTDTAPLGAVFEQYASTLMTAMIRAGAPGRVIRGHYPPATDAAQEGLHARWYFVGLHLHGQDLHIFCVPTSQGVLLMIEARVAPCGAFPPGVHPLPPSAPPPWPWPTRSASRATSDNFPYCRYCGYPNARNTCVLIGAHEWTP